MQRLYYALHKPYGYLSQFTPEGKWKGLSELLNVQDDVYAVGRLDADSEGLLLLTNDKRINGDLLNPKKKHTREYLVQVDGDVTENAIKELNSPLRITVKKSSYVTQAAKAEKVLQPEYITEREPPVRFRKSVPTSWIKLVLTEGKNRQVRKMTAAVGFPTLRLIRLGIEDLQVGNIARGELKEYSESEFKSLLKLTR